MGQTNMLGFPPYPIVVSPISMTHVYAEATASIDTRHRMIKLVSLLLGCRAMSFNWTDRE